MAYEFNGTNQWMTTASAPATTLPITMACWFNSDSVTALQTLVHLVASTTLNNPYFGCFLRGDVAGDPLQMFVYQGSGTPAFDSSNTTSGYTANTWHHACAVFVSSTNRTVYLDGGSSASGSVNLSVTPNQLRIGRFVSSSNLPDYYMDGEIAEIGVWNTDLSAAEITSLAKGMRCSRVRPQNLEFYSPMVRDLTDYSGALAITNNNTATASIHPRVY